MQAAGAREAGAKRGVEHRGGRAQRLAGMLLGQVLHEALRRQAGPGGKQALQVEFADVRRGRDLGQ